MKKKTTLKISICFATLLLALSTVLSITAKAQSASVSISPEKLNQLKKELITEIGNQQKAAQQMVDMVFSFGELGFQEYETSKYLTDILKKNGFTVEQGISGIPTAWIAKWGSGKPLIAIGSDIDCIPKASQKPGVAYHDPIIVGAPITPGSR